ncbi:radical SAM/SPASM domain-containing protein [Flagellimonas myxillae]|uniref:radical SAM/SPASM domain-containing protein n=1 Tax=Flagellimonas myxillae TaxID=2942214 RepID=UPI00201EA9B0|nr:radical SAM protein [Muricauda myxillae]MCL6266926.1 radical SAM protein [Muricauda myxillae]
MISSKNLSVPFHEKEPVLNYAVETENPSGSHKIISGLINELIHLKLKCSLLRIILTTYNNPLDWIQALKYLIRLRRQFLGDNKLKKMAITAGKYYMGLYTPGWNSEVYKKFIVSQLHDFKPVQQKTNRFNTVLMAVTKKCPLQCEHCYEWDNLNKKEVLSAEKLQKIVDKLQEYGVSQIQFSGGEPLLKIDSLVSILKNSREQTDFWVTTSGFKLTQENARRLKQAGLTGVIISLDHFIPEMHNEFRHFKDAFHWVMQGVKNAAREDLVVALSLCTTKEFISESNLRSYMDLAKSLPVSFVQFLEPKAVGHFRGKDVAPSQKQIELLEGFYLKMNFDRSFRSYPIITYHGYYQRRQGCFGAGKKSIYVDTDGDINPCPFCSKKYVNVLDEEFDQALETLKRQGCSIY